MEHSFWHQKWEHNDIGFHQKTANALMVGHFPALGLVDGQRVFVPLCGKTLDIRWMLSQELSVVGIELSRLAVEQLFAELDCVPTISEAGKLVRFSAPNLDIYVGDVFDLTREILGPVDAVYDRAALVALPQNLRERYTARLAEVTACAPQLLIVFDYDQTKADGPPFAISAAEVHRHYDTAYEVICLASIPMPGGMRGLCPATDNVWLLKPIGELGP